MMSAQLVSWPKKDEESPPKLDAARADGAG